MADTAEPGSAFADLSTQPPAARPKRRGPPRLPRGTCIGRYVIIDVIGHGGMGVVYRAYDPELDRRIALKLVRDSRTEPGRLVAEAQALARVSHPNVVHVYDVGTVAEQVFIAMELVEGQTVHAWRSANQPSRRALLDVFLAAGRGLAAAHKAGIVHRDFKPSNVIVGDDGRVRVADFGLARAGDTTMDRTPSRPSLPSGSGAAAVQLATPAERPEARADRPALVPPRVPLPAIETPLERDDEPDRPEAIETGGATVDEPTSATVDIPGGDRADVDPHSVHRTTDDGVDVDLSSTPLDTASDLPRVHASRVMGTPSYMAPEQRRTGVYDARVDQYAFAVALYETLYGERPFDGATDTELAKNALAERFRPPPKGTTVPAHLRRTLLRALSVEPDARFPSMDALLAALGDDPIARRNRRAAIAGAVLLAAVVALILVRRNAGDDPCADAAARLRGTWDAEMSARIDRTLRATGRPYAAAVATRVEAALGARADEWSKLHRDACVAHRRGEVSPELYDRQRACLDRRAGELRALAAELGRRPDAALLDHAPDAVAALPAVAACAERDALLAVPLPADPVVRAKVAALRGELAQVDAHGWTGQYTQSRDRAAELAAQAGALGYPPVAAEALVTAGRAARRAADLAHAEPLLYDGAIAAATARDDRLAAVAWIELLGLVAYDRVHLAESGPLQRAATAAVARAGAPPDLRAHLLHAEALAASSTGDFEQAIAHERQALALREEAGDDLAIAESVNDLARLASSRGDYPGAEALHRRALELRTKALGPDHPLVADSLDNLGVVLSHQSRLAEARDDYERALALRTAALGPDARDVGTSLNNLGGLWLDQGDDARARDYLERALAVWQKALGPEHPDLAIPMTNLADLDNKRGDHDRARELCRRALAIDERAHGADDPDLAYDLVCLGESELDAAPHDAIAHLERALALREKTPGDAGELARTRFDLARALVASNGAATRARGLAADACRTFTTLGGTWATRRDECSRWLAAH